MKLLAKVLLLAAIFEIGGLHWWAMQVVAWTTMIEAEVPNVGLVKAFEKTLSGENPCSLCLKIQNEKKKQADQLWLFGEKKPMLHLLTQTYFCESTQFLKLSKILIFTGHQTEPLTPPPNFIS